MTPIAKTQLGRVRNAIFKAYRLGPKNSTETDALACVKTALEAMGICLKESAHSTLATSPDPETAAAGKEAFSAILVAAQMCLTAWPAAEPAPGPESRALARPVAVQRTAPVAATREALLARLALTPDPRDKNLVIKQLRKISK